MLERPTKPKEKGQKVMNEAQDGSATLKIIKRARVEGGREHDVRRCARMLVVRRGGLR